MRAAEELRPSAEPWFPDVPNAWVETPLWTMFTRTSRKGHGNETLLSVYRDHGVVPKASRDDNFNRASEDLSNYQLVEPGDLVVNKMKAWQGSLSISACRGIVSPAYFVYRPHHGADERYLHHLLRSQPMIAAYVGLSKGVRINQWDLEPQAFSRMKVALPPLEEQRAIADYLDHETSQIDSLIAKQEAIIETLRERREAAVSALVLDLAVPSARLGHVADTLSGWAFSSEGFTASPDHVRLLRGINVKPGFIDWTDCVYWDIDGQPVPSEFELRAGDVVLGMDRPFVGGGVRVAAIQPEDLPALLLQRVLRIRPTERLDADYMRHVFSTGEFKAHLEPDFTGVSVPHVSEWQVRQFKVPLPTLDDQRRIAAELDLMTASIDTLNDRLKEFVALARERRAALITAAVTGQVDVQAA